MKQVPLTRMHLSLFTQTLFILVHCNEKASQKTYFFQMSATFEFMIKNCYNLRDKFSVLNTFFNMYLRKCCVLCYEILNS